jgi:hypothetical protein
VAVAPMEAVARSVFQMKCEWGVGAGRGKGALGTIYFNSSGLIYSSVNCRMYKFYVSWFHLYSSVLKLRNIISLYFSIPKNIKISRNIECFPVVPMWKCL